MPQFDLFSLALRLGLKTAVEPRLDPNGPGSQTDGRSERIAPTSLNFWTFVMARAGPTSGLWLKEPMNAVCHGEERSDVAIHPEF